MPKQREWHPVDETSAPELFALMIGEFGLSRTVQLVGWAVVFGLQGIENTAEVRAKFEAGGVERSRIFRALKDYHRVSDLLWAKHDRRPSFGSLMQEITEIRFAG